MSVTYGALIQSLVTTPCEEAGKGDEFSCQLKSVLWTWYGHSVVCCLIADEWQDLELRSSFELTRTCSFSQDDICTGFVGLWIFGDCAFELGQQSEQSNPDSHAGDYCSRLCLHYVSTVHCLHLFCALRNASLTVIDSTCAFQYPVHHHHRLDS